HHTTNYSHLQSFPTRRSSDLCVRNVRVTEGDESCDPSGEPDHGLVADEIRSDSYAVQIRGEGLVEKHLLLVRGKAAVAGIGLELGRSCCLHSVEGLPLLGGEEID